VIARHDSSSPGELDQLMMFVSRQPDQSYLVPNLFMPPLQYYFPKAVVRSYPPSADLRQVGQIARDHHIAFVCAYGVNPATTVSNTQHSDGSRELACVGN
jgi:hypothetical protein